MILIPYSFVQRLDLQYYAVVELEILAQQQYEYNFILHETKHQILFYCEYLLVLVLVLFLLLVVLMMLVLMLLLVVVLLELKKIDKTWFKTLAYPLVVITLLIFKDADKSA